MFSRALIHGAAGDVHRRPGGQSSEVALAWFVGIWVRACRIVTGLIIQECFGAAHRDGWKRRW